MTFVPRFTSPLLPGSFIPYIIFVFSILVLPSIQPSFPFSSPHHPGFIFSFPFLLLLPLPSLNPANQSSLLLQATMHGSHVPCTTSASWFCFSGS
ncbi:hypothetical protein C8R44DRAFT_820204 [Mycena epipterygia]|nr:hypothetical protein C8R44DRAFT_820204 [Mycena epipterygia]